MSGKQWETHAAYGGLSAGALGRIMGDRELNPFTQAELLAAALAMPFKETGRSHYRDLVQKSQDRHSYQQAQIVDGLAWLEQLGLEQSPLDSFAVLPRYSFALELRFELARPYLSRDDDAFYIIDNPVRKDKVFKMPFVAPTGWKGSLRAAATQELLSAFSGLLPPEPPTDEAGQEALLSRLWQERAQRVRLFGNEKKKDAKFLDHWLTFRLFSWPDELSFEQYLKEHHYLTGNVQGRQGRLFCFPTFFDQIGLEIINPHDRKRRVGKNPILFECAPSGATGTLRLLYIPYDFPGDLTPDETTLRSQVQADLPLVAETVRDLLTVYGFGAKTSSGFGAADPQRVAGELRVNRLDEKAGEVEGPSESLVRRLLMGDPLQYKLHNNFFADGQFVMVPDEEIRQQPWGGRTKADYKKVKPRLEELLAEQPTGPEYLSRPLTDLEDLPDAARELASKIGGAA